MRDAVSIPKVAELHPAIRNEVKAAIEAAEAKFPATVAVRIAQGLRTIDYQNQLYTLGRTVRNPDGASPKKPLGNIVTNARGGKSWHNYGLAIDFAILYDKDGNGKYETLSWDEAKDFDIDGEADWKEVVNIFKASGFEWGGDWKSIKDDPHFEKRFGMPENCSTAYQKYVNKNFIPGTTYINI